MACQDHNSSFTIPAINFFITPTCNMRCRFCFGKFEAEPSYTREIRRQRQLDVIRACADAGIEKITFVGGEPLLSPWLEEELAFAHALGMCTCVVTNGSRITKEWVQRVSGSLDWIGISIDSLNPQTNLESGRALKGAALCESDYRRMIDWVHQAGIRLKINTTVTRWNCQEDMADFLNWAAPERMKMFQALTIDDVNTASSEDFTVSRQAFSDYVKRHRSKGISVVAETSADMKGSYLMVTPGGRFFENIDGSYRYSKPIPDVGYQKAISEIRISLGKFHRRGGVYSWS